MDLFQALTADHNELRPKLAQLIAASQINGDTQQLLDAIAADLVPHSRAEEAVLYNTLLSSEQTKDLVKHNYPEHIEAEALLRTLKGLTMIGIEWTSAAKKLRDALLMHMSHEEEVIFPQARSFFLAAELAQMESAYQQAKIEAQRGGDLKNLGSLVKNLMPSKRSPMAERPTPSGQW